MSEPAAGGSRWAGVVWLTALVAGLLAFWRLRVLSGPVEVLPFENSDLLLYFLPSYTYLADRLQALELPFWNPYQATGQPFLATMQPGVLYPARLLLLGLDVPAAMQVSIVAHVLLVLLATWALCRELGATRGGAATGAVAFTGAFSLPNLFWPSYLEAGTWLPIGALALARLAVDARWRWVVLLGLSAGLPVLAGGYQIMLYVAYGIAFFGLALLADRERRRGLVSAGGVGRIALAAVLALGTAAPQLLPTLAWTGETIRQTGGLTDVQIMPVPNVAHALRETVVPQAGFSPFYLSLPVVVLALVGFARGGPLGRALGLVGIVVYLVSLGRGTPFFVLYHWLPGLAVFRLPRRLFTLVAFFAALGAARAASLAGPGTSRPWRWAEIGLLALVALAVLGPFRNRGALPWSIRDGAYGGPPGLSAATRAAAGAGRIAYPGDSLDIGLAVKQGMLQRMPVVQDYEPLSSRRLGAHLAAAMGAPSPAPTDVIPFAGWVPLKRPIVHPALLDVLGVRALVLPRTVPPPDRAPALVSRFATGRHVVWENPHALPRAYTVERVRFLGDERAALAALASPGFDPMREVVLVGVPGDSETHALADAPATPVAPARLVTDRPERVALEVDVARPALLVLSDAFAPGWTAVVDGAPRRLWLANHLVRGVVVRPGDRRVEFRYRPPGFPLGLGLAAGAWTLFALAVAWQGRERPT